jgi:hypothetical protein
MIPVKTNGLALRMAAMVVAGPAANLLTGFVVLLLPFSMGPLSSMFVLSSLFVGFFNLLPLQKGAELTDGLRVLRLIQCREVGERFMALARLSADIRDDVPPEDLSPDLLAKAIAIKDNSPETVIAHAYAFSAASSRQDDVKAADYLETSLKYSAYAPSHLQQALMSDAASFQAKRKRLDLAQQWLAAMPEKTEIPWLRTNVEAAIREAEGDIEGAVKCLEAIEQVLPAIPNQEHRERARRSLLRRKSKLLSRVAAVPQDEKRA